MGDGAKASDRAGDDAAEREFQLDLFLPHVDIQLAVHAGGAKTLHLARKLGQRDFGRDAEVARAVVEEVHILELGGEAHGRILSVRETGMRDQAAFARSP
jgi:hypothetical protein